MSSTEDLLYQIATAERQLEINRKEKLENKAQKFITVDGLLFSFNSTYFLFYVKEFDSNPILLLLQVILLLTLTLFAVSMVLFLISMKLYDNSTFQMENLINEVYNSEYGIAKKRITGNIVEYLNNQREVNNTRAKFLLNGIRIFFIQVILLIFSIFTSILFITII